MELFIHHAASPYVRKVLLICEEVGIQPAEIVVDYSSEDAMSAYRQLNPTGKFPTLRDGELVLRESNAIMLYLAERHPEAGLDGGDAKNKAQIKQWLFWELAHFADAVHPYAALRMGYPSRSSMSEQELASEFDMQCSLLDGQLAQAGYVVGDSLSIADLAIAADLSYVGEAGLSLSEYRNLERWFAGIRERRSWQVTEERKREALD